MGTALESREEESFTRSTPERGRETETERSRGETDRQTETERQGETEREGGREKQGERGGKGEGERGEERDGGGGGGERETERDDRSSRPVLQDSLPGHPQPTPRSLQRAISGSQT